MKRLNALIFMTLIFVLTSLPLAAQAHEMVFFGGSLSHRSLGGCCTNTGSKNGFGLLGRLSLGSDLGTVDLLGYSDGRWSEGVLLFPINIKGTAARSDDSPSNMVRAKIVSDWRWVYSVGFGTFTYTGRTKDYDLPIRISGAQLTNSNQVFYNLNKDLSLVAMVNLSFAASSVDQSFLLGLHLGLGYDF